MGDKRRPVSVVQRMKFYATDLADAVLIEMAPFEDSRGYFSRTFCASEFDAAGLETQFVQANLSLSHRTGTLRGMHYQTSEHAEVKVVRCVSGAIYDVVVDLRSDSPTYLRWQGFELTDNNNLQLYVPRGFAHGFVTLCDTAAVSYMVSAAYTPGAEGGLRWNDPALGITWPVDVTTLSDKDAAWPDLDESRLDFRR